LRRGENTIEEVSLPYVATPEVLALYGIDPATIGADVDLISSRNQSLLLIVPPALRPDEAGSGKGRADFDAPPVSTQAVDLPTWSEAPNSLITEAGMHRRGLVAVRGAWIVESERGFTAAQISAARTAAATVGLAIEGRDQQDGLASVRTGATIVGAALAIAIVAMTVGLIRSESSRDVRTLTATGAAGRTRRAITASTAAALAVLGVVLGVGGAYIALIAGFHSKLSRLSPIPMSNLLSIAIGLPVVATVAGWLLAGREPRTFARQSLD
jgi:putative ABC transport system permease protein